MCVVGDALDQWHKHLAAVLRMRGIQAPDRRRQRIGKLLHTNAGCLDYGSGCGGVLQFVRRHNGSPGRRAARARTSSFFAIVRKERPTYLLENACLRPTSTTRCSRCIHVRGEIGKPTAEPSGKPSRFSRHRPPARCCSDASVPVPVRVWSHNDQHFDAVAFVGLERQRNVFR